MNRSSIALHVVEASFRQRNHALKNPCLQVCLQPWTALGQACRSDLQSRARQVDLGTLEPREGSVRFQVQCPRTEKVNMQGTPHLAREADTVAFNREECTLAIAKQLQADSKQLSHVRGKPGASSGASTCHPTCCSHPLQDRLSGSPG